MASLTIDLQDVLMEATAVSNAFISQYMPTAPEGYAKVYLYGLMLVHSGNPAPQDLTEELAMALDMKNTEIAAAFRYWERVRLVERISNEPLVYKYRSVQQVLLQKRQLPSDDEYERFSASLYAMFGSKRKIHGGESSLAFEWVEKLGLEPEVVLMLLRYMMDTRGVRFSFKEAQKKALAMKEQSITTPEEAEAYFQRSGSLYTGCTAVLRKLGMRRQPSEPEVELYKKWTLDWNISADAVLRACDETVKGNPNFGYLDGIISNIYQQAGGAGVSAKGMEAALQGNRQETEQIRMLLSALGIRREVIDDGLRAVFRTLAHYGQDLLLLAAKRCSMHENTRSFDCLQELLASWNQKGLTDVQAVQEYLQKIDEVDQMLRNLSQKAGQTINRSNVNRALLRKWLDEWKMPYELIELAAGYAADTKRSMPYMDKLLSAWNDKGIRTEADARKEHELFQKGESSATSAASKPGKRVIEQQYRQRPTTPDMDELPPELLEEVKKL